MKRLTLTASLLALAGVLTFAPLFADDPAETKSRKSDKTQRADQNDKGDRAEKGQHEHPLPACLEKLSLNEEQQAKIREIVNKYEGETESVWHQFKHAYRDTIRTEVLLITAIEDNLTEDQQKQVRNARRTRAHEAQASGKIRGSSRTVSDTASRTEARIKKETGTATEGENRQKGEKDPAGAIEATELANITLTQEQEEIAEELHDKYVSRLRSQSRHIDALHARLVALEADELAEIETVLNKEQLEQLREGRKEAPARAKVAEREREAGGKSTNE